MLGPIPRIHLSLSVALSSSALSIEPAYDTGASVSVLSQADFNKIRHDTLGQLRDGRAPSLLQTALISACQGLTSLNYFSKKNLTYLRSSFLLT